MTIQDNAIIQPIPTDELLAEKERKWRLVLPTDYRSFIVKYNGVYQMYLSILIKLSHSITNSRIAEKVMPYRIPSQRLCRWGL